MITRTRWMSRPLDAVFVGLLAGSLVACGDNNLFSGLADENSTQAKMERAQIALDDGDCQTALTLFGELQADDPTSVARRLDLSAAHLCAAGFEVSSFLDVAAAFGAGTVTGTTVFEAIADQAVATINASWPTDIGAAEGLLATTLSPPTAYNNDPDAAFNLAIVEVVRAAMTVADLLNYVNGIADCSADPGGVCEITDADAQAIATALANADTVLSDLGVTSEVRDAINAALTELENTNADGNPSVVSCADLEQFLVDQGFNGANQISCV